MATGALLAAPMVGAQPPGKVYRVGYLAANPLQSFSHLFEAFKEGLRELGYIEGRNLAIEYRSAEGKLERLDALALELVRSNVDVIVTGINATTHAARRATKTIPIVMTVGTDVVGEGFAASLARPGGNVTGVTWDVGPGVVTKSFQFLKEAVPKLSRIAILWDQGQDAPSMKRAIEEGVRAVGAKPIWLEVGDDLAPAFDTAVREGAQAISLGGGSRLFRLRKQVVELAARHRLPDKHYDSAFVDEGGLMSYAPNLAALYRSAAKHVQRILKGAKPGDLPVEQPMRIDLVINLKTAKKLGLNIPQSLLMRADRLIE